MFVCLQPGLRVVALKGFSHHILLLVAALKLFRAVALARLDGWMLAAETSQPVDIAKLWDTVPGLKDRKARKSWRGRERCFCLELFGTDCSTPL